VVALPAGIGRSKKKVRFTSLFSKSAAINWLSAARLFLFGARDVWFVVGLPLFLSQLGWTFTGVGAFIALWFVGYGIVQALVPDILRSIGREKVDGPAAQHWAFILLIVPLGLIGALRAGLNPSVSLMIGLAIFAIVFAINSAVHSYLVLAYTDEDSVALNVGFYYMANAGGRLLGTLLSGLIFQRAGFKGCLWGSAVMVLIAAIISLELPRGNPVQLSMAVEGVE
jgi:predicted MFS family arabinose efflux permease